LKQGNYVYFQHFANTKMVFEGFTFFRMRQRHIFAIQQNKQINYEPV
jgi:co-chaperonin GroES (HSP10)